MEITQGLVADFDAGDLATIRPFPHPTQMSIMPVVAMKGQYLRGVGTCFAISSHGLVLTARHVLEDVLELDQHGQPKDPGLWVGAVYAATPGPDDAVPDLLGGPIPANKVHYSESHDIALMHLPVPRRRRAGEPLAMPPLALDVRAPREGERCIAMGYHAMDWKRATGAHTHEVVQSYSASRGRVRSVHLTKRDDLLLNFPCFQTDCELLGGMSGGPVISTVSGSAIAVVCSGFDVPEGEGHISYASLAATSLLLALDATTEDGTVERKFLYDCVQGGAVTTKEPPRLVSDRREGGERTLTIDCNGVHIRNTLVT